MPEHLIVRDDEIIVFKTLIKFGRWCFIFPRSGCKFDMKFAMKFFLTLLILSFPSYFGVVGHLYQSYLKKDWSNLMFAALAINYILLLGGGITILFFRWNVMTKLLCALSKVEPGYLDEYEKVIKNIEFKTKLIYYIVFIDVFFLTVGSYITKLTCSEPEFLSDPHYVCGLVMPIWYPFQLDNRLRPILAAYTMILSLLYMPVLTAGNTLYLMNQLIIVKMHYIVSRLKQIDIEGRNIRKIRETLIYCVDSYFEVTRLMYLMNNSIGYIFILMDNGYNIFMIGLSAFSLTTNGIDRLDIIIPNIIQIVMWVLLVWLSCNSGQCLEDANNFIKEELYNISWYHLDPSLRNIFKIFQVLIDRPFQSVVQPFTVLNMHHFSEVIKGSYTLFMFFQKMRE